MKKVALAIVLALHSGTALAQEFTSPLDVMETLYAAYLSGVEVHDLSPYFSDRLMEEIGDAHLSPEIIANMGVDPMIGATDAQLSQLFIDDAGGGGKRAVVEVRFHNRRVPVELTFQLVLEPAVGWQIDHFHGKSGEIEWSAQTLAEAATRMSEAK
jgi:hypothetical protein